MLPSESLARFAPSQRPASAVLVAAFAVFALVALVTAGCKPTPWDLVWGGPNDALDDDAVALMLLLLDAGASPSTAEEPEGLTRLHVAARKADSAGLMSALVGDGRGDVDATDDNGWTALHVAAHENHVDSVRGLLSAGADPNAETTKSIGSSSWRHQAGSRPLDVLPRPSRIVDPRGVEKVLAGHGGTDNPDVDNRRR